MSVEKRHEIVSKVLILFHEMFLQYSEYQYAYEIVEKVFSTIWWSNRFSFCCRI